MDSLNLQSALLVTLAPNWNQLLGSSLLRNHGRWLVAVAWTTAAAGAIGTAALWLVSTLLLAGILYIRRTNGTLGGSADEGPPTHYCGQIGSVWLCCVALVAILVKVSGFRNLLLLYYGVIGFVWQDT